MDKSTYKYDDIWCPLNEECLLVCWSTKRTTIPSRCETYSLRVAFVDPGGQAAQSILLRTIAVFDEVPGLEVSRLGNLDLDLAVIRPCCKRVPTAVGSDDCGVLISVLDDDHPLNMRASNLTCKVGSSYLRAGGFSLVEDRLCRSTCLAVTLLCDWEGQGSFCQTKQGGTGEGRCQHGEDCVQRFN